MKFKLQLVCEPGENETACTDEIFTFDKSFDTFESIGMTLCESKQLLKNMQQSIVEKQLGAFIKSKGLERLRKKGNYKVKLKTLFGDITFDSPRYYGEDKKTFSPLNELLPNHTTPELLFLETKWACLIPFEKTANLLKEVLPVAETINATTIQNHLYGLALAQEKEVGEEQWMYDCGSINQRQALPRPERTMVVGIDGGYVRDWKDKKSMFEVIAGKSLPAEKPAKCFAFVGSYDLKSKRRFYNHLTSQGMQPHQQIEFFSDGADNLRNLQTYLNAESKHILDWFHITMKLTVLHQCALGLIKVDENRGKAFQHLLTRIKWNLWHGNAVRAIEYCDNLHLYLTDHLEDKAQKKKYDKIRPLQTYVTDFDKYIANNQSFIVNYAERYHYGEVVSTGFVESTVNYVIAKRFSKKQSMQWTRKGAHLLLQVRTKVLNNEWEEVFRKRYPDFRPITLVKDPDIVQEAA
jgi:hypothetical protein